MKILALLGFIIISNISFSQGEPEKISDLTSSANEIDTQLEIFKTKSNKTFQLKEGSNVWVYCKNKKGQTRIKRCQIINIREDTITFKPFDKKFELTKYVTSDITFIGFTSAGRIIVASISNVVIAAAVVVVVAVAAMIYILSAGFLPNSSNNSPSSNNSSDWQIFVPFRKNISFLEDKHGNRKWDIRIVGTLR